MPDTWEYPWYAAWDLAFHVLPLSLVDPAFGKNQLELLLRERYLHPNGQLNTYCHLRRHPCQTPNRPRKLPVIRFTQC